MNFFKKFCAFTSSYLLFISAHAQSGRWDFSTELGSDASSSSGFAAYVVGFLIVLGIIFGGKEIRQLLLSVILTLVGFGIYMYALFKIGSAINVWTSGDTPKNREISAYGLVIFLVGWFLPIYIYSKLHSDDDSKKKYQIQLVAIFSTVAIGFVFSTLYFLKLDGKESPLSFLFISPDDAIVECVQLPDGLKMSAKNCPKETENFFHQFDKNYTLKEVKEYQQNLEIESLKQRLAKQEWQIEMQRRNAIDAANQAEAQNSAPISVFDSQTGTYKFCSRFGSTISCL
jgi:glucan phosphoethanolaminetransferase (alkaline phosphatase superfamily)